MKTSYKEIIGWLFLASLLLSAVLWGGRLWNTASLYFGPKTEVQLYVAAPGGGLEVVDVKIPSRQLNAETLWKRLQAVSQDGRPTLLPQGASLLEARQEGGTLVISLSGELVRSQYLGSNQETALVYSIVNTMAQLPEIESVQILIEGRVVESLADHVDLTAPLRPDYTLVTAN
ncbi:MAG: GerMN domain-containing protein [Firmicutes bacterium]|nr:GerMN domain-containing protein [Bacillota bacterium]